MEPVIIDTTAGLAYTLTFDIAQIPIQRQGLIVQTHTGPVDISYTAPTSLFHTQITMFDTVVQNIAYIEAPLKPSAESLGLGKQL